MAHTTGTSTAPTLVHRTEFETVLEHYHVNQHAQRILNDEKLVVLTGPSSSGRNTIIEHLVASGDYHFIVSDTTRPPRINNGVTEVNGREYWFRTEEEMLDDLKKGESLEAEVIHGQQVSGISIRELKKALQEERIAITDVDIGGIQNILHAKPDTVAIVMLPPDFDEWQRRLQGRGHMDPSEFERRMSTACRIFASSLENPYVTFIVNRTIEQTAQQINALVKLGSVDPHSQTEARQLAERLLQQTQALLRQSV